MPRYIVIIVFVLTSLYFGLQIITQKGTETGRKIIQGLWCMRFAIYGIVIVGTFALYGIVIVATFALYGIVIAATFAKNSQELFPHSFKKK